MDKDEIGGERDPEILDMLRNRADRQHTNWSVQTRLQLNRAKQLRSQPSADFLSYIELGWYVRAPVGAVHP